MWRNRHFEENGLFIVVTEWIGMCNKNKGIVYRFWFQALAEYSKLLVIQYPSIWNSHASGRNFKDNLPFYKIASKIKLWHVYVHLPCICSPSPHWEHCLFSIIGVIRVMMHDYSRCRIWDHVAVYSTWNLSLISFCLQEGTQELKQKCVVLSLKQKIKILTWKR